MELPFLSKGGGHSRWDQVKRPLASPWDALWIALLLVVALLGWYRLELQPSSPALAHVYLSSQEVLTLDLGTEKARDIPVPGSPSVVLQLDGQGGISFLHSDCPDQICVHSGRLHRPGESAACLPNRVFIRLTARPGDSAEVDFAVGGR